MTPNGYLSKKILLVDDDESIISLIETVLNKEGYTRIFKAGSGKEAILKVNEDEPDLIVLDVMLPDFDGFASQRCTWRTYAPRFRMTSSGVSPPSNIAVSTFQTAPRKSLAKTSSNARRSAVLA